MCNRSKEVFCLLAGMAVGVMIGYSNENEIEEFARSSRRAKRKMMRKMHDVRDQLDI